MSAQMFCVYMSDESIKQTNYPEALDNKLWCVWSVPINAVHMKSKVSI